MNFGNFSDNLPLIIGLIALIAFQYFMRRRRPALTNQTQIAQGLLSEVRLNLRIADSFSYELRTRKFMTTTWKMAQNKLDFLGQETQTAITDAFTLADDYNQQISDAKKFKSTSYLSAINIDRLKENLAKSEEGLTAWLKMKTGSADTQIKTPGIFGDWTGG